MNRQKILFLLPGIPNKPVGGYKIVYEYAQRLAEAGFSVSIFYANERCFSSIKKNDETALTWVKRKFRHTRRFFKQTLKKDYLVQWFSLHKAIKEKLLPYFTKKYLKKYKNQTIICTSIHTAYELNDIQCIPRKNKYYFIQDFENWNLSDEDVYRSYRFPMKKITIAPWLKEKIQSVGETAEMIPNGFDFNYFHLFCPIEQRIPTEVAMLYHLDERKRCQDAISALKIVKQTIPELHVTLFGTPPIPENLPEWCTYCYRPNQEEHNAIYNNAAIFVAASRAEGMALPPGEAMSCGCALCCTDIGGFQMYAIAEETALLSPVYDTEKLAENIARLIQDSDLRIRIARAGYKLIHQYTWENAFTRFKKALNLD